MSMPWYGPSSYQPDGHFCSYLAGTTDQYWSCLHVSAVYAASTILTPGPGLEVNLPYAYLVVSRHRDSSIRHPKFPWRELPASNTTEQDSCCPCQFQIKQQVELRGLNEACPLQQGESRPPTPLDTQPSSIRKGCHNRLPKDTQHGISWRCL
jgi:hypothetical protein